MEQYGGEQLDLKNAVVGFSQSEKEANPFRIAETQSIKDEAAKIGIPTGNLQWSPRLGFNWDVTGDKRNQLRGGAPVRVFNDRGDFEGLARVTDDVRDGVIVATRVR